MGSKSGEVHTYASTTASPPSIQISLDDSVDTDYKEAHFVGGNGLISPGTDFSEQVCASFLCVLNLIQGGFFKDGSDEDSTGAPPFVPSYSRYRTQMSSVSTPVANESGTLMSGCTWHTVNSNNASSPARGQHTIISLSQSLPPASPGHNSPLSSLTQQIRMAMAMENSGLGVDTQAAAQMTEVLMNTVSGLNTLRSALGEGVLGEFLALLLKDSSRSSSGGGAGTADSGQTYLPVGLLDN